MIDVVIYMQLKIIYLSVDRDLIHSRETPTCVTGLICHEKSKEIRRGYKFSRCYVLFCFIFALDLLRSLERIVTWS